MNASKTRTRKTTIQKVDLSTLTDKQVNALPDEVFMASITAWGRRLLKAAEPFKGKLKAVK